MSVFECERLAQEYAEWLRRGLTAQVQGEVCVIASPFVDRHRDFLQIVIRGTDSDLLLTDDGYLIRDLRISGLADISQMEFSASMIATRHGNTDYMAVL